MSQVNLPFIEDLLARERVLSWQGNSSLGGTRIVFKNPVALARVDDLIEADALQKGYWVRIEYNALTDLGLKYHGVLLETEIVISNISKRSTPR